MNPEIEQPSWDNEILKMWWGHWLKCSLQQTVNKWQHEFPFGSESEASTTHFNSCQSIIDYEGSYSLLAH